MLSERVFINVVNKCIGDDVTRKQHFPRLVVFFGPDSAGKSTQARLFVAYLRSHKYRSKRIWIRGRHTLAFVLANIFVRLGYYQIAEPTPGTKTKLFDPHLLPKLKALWGLIEFVSVLPLIFLKVYLPRFLGYIVVAERYTIDTIVYLAYWLGSDFLQGRLTKILLSFIPQDSLLIHLNAKTQILLRRIRNDIVTRDFLVFQQQVYLELAKKLDAVTIDTSKHSVEDTFHSIVELFSIKGKNHG